MVHTTTTISSGSEIYDCAIFCMFQDSATHTNRNDKTAIDLTWQAPGGPSTANVTLWYVLACKLMHLDKSP